MSLFKKLSLRKKEGSELDHDEKDFFDTEYASTNEDEDRASFSELKPKKSCEPSGAFLSEKQHVSSEEDDNDEDDLAGFFDGMPGRSRSAPNKTVSFVNKCKSDDDDDEASIFEGSKPRLKPKIQQTRNEANGRAFFPISTRAEFGADAILEAKKEVCEEFGDKFGDLKLKKFGDSANNRGYFFEGREKRQQFMPTQKYGTELFDEAYHIQEGPLFKQQFADRSNISITGGDGKHKFIESYDECGFSKEIMDNLSKLKYHRPLPVQKIVIPIIQTENFDVVAHAQTGTGKSAAFLLPLVSEIQKLKTRRGISRNNSKPFAIIIAPTKELVQQLCESARSFAQGTDVMIEYAFGDMKIHECMKAIKLGCDIYVGTMGRLLHFIGDGKLLLDNVEYLVLDEADEILAENFFEDTLLIKNHPSLNPSHRTLLFSATFSPESRLKFDSLVKPNYIFVQVGEINSATQTVRQNFIEVPRDSKWVELKKLLMTMATEVPRVDKRSTYFKVDKCMVFVELKRQSDLLAIKLAQVGFSVISLNSDRTLKQRMDAKDKFIRGEYEILVCTHLGAKGLNFPGVTRVINFDLPEQDRFDYIHRIGRCGRIGNQGYSTSFFDECSEYDYRYAEFYVETLTKAGQEVPSFLKKIVEDQRNCVHPAVVSEFPRRPRRNNWQQ